MRTAWLLALMCTSVAAAPRDEALAVVERWAAAFAASDVDAIVALHAPDATFVGTSSTGVLTGHDAIRGYFERALLADRPRGALLGERAVTVVSPREVVVTGLDTTTRVREGVRVEAPGRVTFVVAKQGGDWRIVHFHRSALPAEPTAAGARALFDGAAARWSIENDAAITIADGVIRAPGSSGWLRFPGTFRDFRLRAEVRFTTETGDSGVFFRAQPAVTFGRGWPNNSYQVQLMHPAAMGRLPPVGGLFRHAMPPGETALDTQAVVGAFTGTNEWQLVEVEVVGTSVTAWLNGTLVMRATDLVDQEGAIGIQNETSTVEIRRVEIEPLGRP
jgi:uncharacterized protein (TIGR02246 family)